MQPEAQQATHAMEVRKSAECGVGEVQNRRFRLRHAEGPPRLPEEAAPLLFLYFRHLQSRFQARKRPATHFPPFSRRRFSGSIFFRAVSFICVLFTHLIIRFRPKPAPRCATPPLKQRPQRRSARAVPLLSASPASADFLRHYFRH